MLAEQQTEYIINSHLDNKGWVVDGKDKLKNVYFQKPKTDEQKTKLQSKKPDYILYQTGSEQIIAIIEAKKPGIQLKDAIEQSTEYATLLNAQIVFATNGAYCETRFVANGKELILNGEEVRGLLREKEILAFITANSNEAWTIPLEVKVSREKLISIFKNLNNVLRAEGIRAGIERFSEFANILFLKLLSEDEKISWWSSIKEQTNDHIIGFINCYVMGQIQEKYGGDVFTPISIKNPSTLRHVIDAIDPLILSIIDSDIKGDAFEYFLEKTTSTENDLGEYFTPRNIVRTIVNIIQPKFGETIYDPFCGTGGFLTKSFKYIKENTIIKNKEELTTLKHRTLYGREITTTARIAKMNMILQGDGHSGIQQLNSLENPEYLDQKTQESIKFDIIITNMPFAQEITKKIMQNGKTVTENHIAPLYYNGIAKNNGDAACVLHALRNLKEGGRMALVVPEGFLLKKTLANVRQFLLSKAKLQAVISLPQGVFLPYTAVKTDILYFTDVHETNNQKEYWFYEVSNIGVTLDNHKKKIKGINDLDKVESSDINRIDKKPELQDKMLELGFEIINMEQIKNNHYNLVGKIYREMTYSGEWKMVKLGEVAKIESGNRPKGGIEPLTEGAINLGATQIGLDGRLNLAVIPYVTIDFYKNAKKGLVQDRDILMCKDGALTGKVCIVDQRYLLQKEVMVNEHIFRSNHSSILQTYLFYCLQSEAIQNQIKKLAYNKSAQAGLNKDHIDSIIILIPPLHIQKQIVAELDSYNKIINGLKQSIDGWKPYFDIDKNWEVVRLEEVCKIVRGGSPRPIEDYITRDIDGINWLKIVDVRLDAKYIYSTKEKITKSGLHKTRLVKKGDIILSNSMSFGRPFIMEIQACIHDGWLAFQEISKKILTDYLYNILISDISQSQFNKSATGTTVKNLNIDIVQNIQIPLPPLHVQQEIVDELEAQRKMIDKYKEDIKYFEGKMKNKLDSLWQDAGKLPDSE